MPSNSLEPAILAATREISARGRTIGLPMIATWADISSARPATIGRNIPIAALFKFATDAGEYWLQPDLALENAIVTIIRWTAEPFYYDCGEIGGWRPLRIAPELERQKNRMTLSIRGAIVAPIHLPGSVIGAVVWATDQPCGNMRALFNQHAADLHVLALRFVSACNAAMHGEPRIRAYHLTRREIQCLKLAAAGKTDEEIAIILGVAIPTVRFHFKKAGSKLGESGRLRIVHHATALGFVSMRL
jgi:LuxR family transcriptional regulator, quorum-sensing system regulator SdiA